MVWVDRCGWCKHVLQNKGLMARCEAFPNGYPRGFREKNGKECAKGYRFEVKEDLKEDYERFKHIWEH